MRRPLAARLLGAALLLTACRSSATPPEAEMLPFALAVRSDTPYVSGAIAERSVSPQGAVAVLVRARSTTDGTSRQPAALVRVDPDSLLLWADGRAARPADLTVGREVKVWVRGPESRSLPPQVTGSAILVVR
ncbi:hypothetical protein [Roseisolibacter agri]|uniref:DUF3221 domain-containing protein n=1 Tax=Roseisolibacter agri TaxID=2014610 RepID=A0AA37Q4B4_9BACT|nr:hypothetical protein [Roseisolibacter agri]GLC23522.1 hypothetical protein rosag_00350 [Roseisolibacter agri]